MSYGLLKGFGQGLAQSGTMLAANQFDKMKEERFQTYQKAAEQRQNQRQDQIRSEDQAIRSTERAEDREERDSRFTQEQDNWDARFGLEERGLLRREMESDRDYKLRQDQFGLASQQIQQQLEIGNLSLQESQRLRQINDVIINPDSAPEDVTRAVETLRNLKGGDPARYSAITLYEDGEDSFGQPIQIRQSGVLNQATGQVVPASMQQSAPDPFNGDPEDVVMERLRSANPGMSDDVLLQYIRSQRQPSPGGMGL